MAFEPSSCPNGRYVVFSIGGHGGAKTRTIWRMELLVAEISNSSATAKMIYIRSAHPMENGSFDDSKVGLVRGHTDSDVVLLEESKP